MSVPLTRGSITALLAPTYRQVYIEAGEERAAEYPLVMHVGPLEWQDQTDQQIAMLGTQPRKSEGGQFPTDSIKIGGTVTYTSYPYGLASVITHEAWRDDLYGALREIPAALKRAANYRKEVEAWKRFNEAFTTAGGFDNDYLCTTTHTRSGDGGTSSNRPAVDISFSITGLQAGIMSFETMVNERGMPQVMSPNMCLIPPQKKWIAREILGSGGVPYKADNEINAIIADDLTWMVCHYFTSSTAWFLINKQNHDVNFLIREDDIFDMFDDPNTMNAVCTSYQDIASSAHGSWRGTYGSTG